MCACMRVCMWYEHAYSLKFLLQDPHLSAFFQTYHMHQLADRDRLIHVRIVTQLSIWKIGYTPKLAHTNAYLPTHRAHHTHHARTHTTSTRTHTLHSQHTGDPRTEGSVFLSLHGLSAIHLQRTVFVHVRTVDLNGVASDAFDSPLQVCV